MNDTPTEAREADPVLAEVWRIKEEIAQEHGYDVRRIAAAAIEAQNQHPERIVDRSTRSAEQAGADQQATRCESKPE
jgi:hypothetical protein